jgi:gliding motility-associatede transport system auxiliary component
VNIRTVATNLDNQNNPKPEAGDLKGPLVMMAAAENQATSARLIVIGDWQWTYNDAITLFDGQYLWTNMIDWLTQYLTNITVNPVIKQLPLTVDQQSLNIVTVITLVIMPGLVLVLGGFVWWSRLRRQ